MTTHTVPGFDGRIHNTPSQTKEQRKQEKDKRAAPLFRGRFLAEKVRERRELREQIGDWYE